MRRSCHERDRGAAARRFGGHRVAHATARPVADEAHGVEILERRPGRYEHGPARERRRAGEMGVRRLDDLVRFGQAALPHPAAGEIPLAWLHEAHAASGERGEVRGHGRVLEHVRVHRRREQHRRRGGEIERAQEVVGQAVREAGDGVGRRRHDEQQIGRRRERDVLDVGIEARRPLARDDAPPGDRLEGQLADEAAGALRHHDGDVVALLLEAAHDLDRLVGADAAAHAHRDSCHAALPPALRAAAPR